MDSAKGSAQRSPFFPRVSFRTDQCTCRLPLPKRKRKKERREGYGATHWRVSGNRLSAAAVAAAAAAGNRKKPEPSSEIEVQGKNRVPFIFTIGSRLNRSAAVSSPPPNGERERERGREHVRYTRLAVSRALSSFLLVSSFAREEDPFLERHQSARFFRPKKAEPPLPLNPRPLPPLLPRGFPPPNDFQRATEIEILLSIWKMKFNKSYLIIYRLLSLYIYINT